MTNLPQSVVKERKKITKQQCLPKTVDRNNLISKPKMLLILQAQAKKKKRLNVLDFKCKAKYYTK